MRITTIEGTVAVQVPGTDAPVAGTLKSCIFDGLTLNLEPGTHLHKLHKLIADGQVLGLALILKEDNV
jgi:hypothetical protein